MMRNEPLTLPFAGGRYWDRTSDLFGVNDGSRRGQRDSNSLTCTFLPQDAPAHPSAMQDHDARPTHDLAFGIGFAGIPHTPNIEGAAPCLVRTRLR